MNKLSIGLFCAVAGLVTFTGCKKFVDVNENANVNTNSRADFVMTGALGTSYRNMNGTNEMIVPGTWSGVYAHSGSFTGGGNEKTYEYTSADFNAFAPIFDNLYDYETVKMTADRDGYGFFKDPADIMQCLLYQRLVDMYGDVPYSQALKGAANIQPAYDNAQTIYENLVVRLDSAMDRIQRTTWPTDAIFTVQDIYFQLNKTRWIQFANSIKLRILMRQSFMPGRGAYIQSALATRLSLGFINQNALCSPGYQNVTGKLNPFYVNFGFNENNTQVQNNQYRKMNAVIINFLKAPGGGPADTFRLQSLAYPAGNSFGTAALSGTSITSGTATVSQYVGIPLAVQTITTTGASPIGPFVIQSPNSFKPGYMMLLAENFFNQSEYAERYGSLPIFGAGATAQTLYEAGILSHFRTIGVGVAGPFTANPGNAANATADPFATRYIARTNDLVSLAASSNRLRTILVQKWLAFTHVNGLEQWSDYRKSSNTVTGNNTGLASSVPTSPRTTATTANPEPSRYVYPQGEFDNNTANVPAVTRFTPIFWDVN